MTFGHELEKLGRHQAVAHVVRVDQLTKESLVHTPRSFRQFEYLEIRRLALLHLRLQPRTVLCHQLSLRRVGNAVAIWRTNHDHTSAMIFSETNDCFEVVNVLLLRHTRHRRTHDSLYLISRSQPPCRV